MGVDNEGDDDGVGVEVVCVMDDSGRCWLGGDSQAVLDGEGGALKGCHGDGSFARDGWEGVERHVVDAQVSDVPGFVTSVGRIVPGVDMTATGGNKDGVGGDWMWMGGDGPELSEGMLVWAEWW